MPGVRNSIRTVVGYVGMALAAIIAVSSAGIDLSSLALIAGGLSLGIGFGLQNIVSNFVSGLILLAERPFKAGDWIVTGEVSGTVKKISVRATEIETFQRQTVIMPNSELINRAVGNWTLRNKLGRVDIRVNVAYGSDVRRAHAIMLEIAASHPLVLKNPEPFVLFANFGPAALEFEMRDVPRRHPERQYRCRTTSASRSWRPSRAKASTSPRRRVPRSGRPGTRRPSLTPSRPRAEPAARRRSSGAGSARKDDDGSRHRDPGRGTPVAIQLPFIGAAL